MAVTGVLHGDGSLRDQLEEYCEKGLYPFHMPGHKRRMEPAAGLPFSWDLTEVPGTDDLHDAQGVLLEAMQRTARLCGADRTWYLVNGSTCGLLAGIRALVRPGSEVICARNCHKAVFHALELAGCRVHWLMPPVDPDWGICGSISADMVSNALLRHPHSRAVILTSPTYEGILSPVEEICRECHGRGIPVLVDEAHGAHLIPSSEKYGFPRGALACGADLVVQSPHKTLPSLTQTALLHIRGTLVDAGRIEEELDVFETSSPSYPLMASLDGCTDILIRKGDDLFGAWAERIARFVFMVRNLRYIRVLNCFSAEDSLDPGMFYSCDPGKILIDAGGAGLSGSGLARILRENYGMETEMSEGSLVLAMTSVCDDEDALDRLAAALSEIDGKRNEPPAGGGKSTQDRKAGGAGLFEGDRKSTRDNKGVAAEKGGVPRRKPAFEKASAGAGVLRDLLYQLERCRPAAACTMAQARAQDWEEVPLRQASGRICAEYLYFYPPGIPFLAPGEIIGDKMLRLLLQARECGAVPFRKKSGSGIRCIRE